MLNHLCDHPADVAAVVGQQDGVGLLGELREGGDVLLRDAQRRRCVSVLRDAKAIHSLCDGARRHAAAAAHLLGQSLRQDPDGLGLGVRFGHDGLGLTCGSAGAHTPC